MNSPGYIFIPSNYTVDPAEPCRLKNLIILNIDCGQFWPHFSLSAQTANPMKLSNSATILRYLEYRAFSLGIIGLQCHLGSSKWGYPEQFRCLLYAPGFSSLSAEISNSAQKFIIVRLKCHQINIINTESSLRWPLVWPVDRQYKYWISGE